MILKHLLILVLANCIVDSTINTNPQAVQSKEASAYLVISGDNLSHQQVNSQPLLTQGLINPKLKLAEMSASLVTPLFGNYIFATDIKMNKGEYVKHVLIDRETILEIITSRF